MATEILIKKRVSGAAGAPASLKSGELAYNMVDGKIYVGFGDNGAGVGTSVKAIAGDNFASNLPSGYANGDILTVSGGILVWAPAPPADVYTASGDGIELTGANFALNFAEVATGVGLGNYALTTALTSGLAGKADTAHTHAAADVTSGVFDLARIPDFDAAKVTTGAFDAARIPSLDAAKIATGAFDAARIPSLDASKIGTGTIDVARLPTNVFQAPIVAATNIASLTLGQQTDILTGSTVVTSDGVFWSYVSGSKTLEASYRAMADTTPEWTAIANKPAFATVATSGAYSDLSGTPVLATIATSGAYSDLSGAPALSAVATSGAYADLTGKPALHAVATSGDYVDLINKPVLATVATTGAYADLTGKPSLGTMAAQNASAVAITGGTIDNVVLDGGVF